MDNRINELLERIIKDIETGTFNFKYDWKLTGTPPQNFISKHIYTGFNAFLLKYFSSDTYFMTFLQAKERGIKIRAKESGYRIIYWKLLDRIDPKEEKVTKFPFMRISYVFGLSQTDNFKPENNSALTIPKPEEILNNYQYKPEIMIGDRDPAFNRTHNFIRMPSIDKFNSPNEYYSVLFHELAHSTKIHLKRDYKDYAKEELLAELTANIICNYLDIQTSFTEENTKAYLKNWLEQAKKSPRYLMEVITDAEAAFRLICFNELKTKGQNNEN